MAVTVVATTMTAVVHVVMVPVLLVAIETIVAVEVIIIVIAPVSVPTGIGVAVVIAIAVIVLAIVVPVATTIVAVAITLVSIVVAVVRIVAAETLVIVTATPGMLALEVVVVQPMPDRVDRVGELGRAARTQAKTEVDANFGTGALDPPVLGGKRENGTGRQVKEKKEREGEIVSSSLQGGGAILVWSFIG